MTISKKEALELITDKGKFPLNWKSIAKQKCIDVTGLTSQDVWDIINEDEIICPICNSRKRKVLQTNIGRAKTCGEKECSLSHKRQKTEKTSMDRYGVRRPSQSAESKEALRNTIFANHNGEWHLSKPEYKEKKRNTNVERYGHPVPSMSESKKANSILKQQKSRKQNYINIVWPERKKNIFNELNITALTNWTGAHNPITWLHETCGHKWESKIPDDAFPWCPKCNLSKEQFGLEKFISDNYSGQIIRNCRSIINPYELDIYLPELNIAFEMNGWYWHKEGTCLISPSKKHKICEEKGIRLITIMDWEWNDSLYRRIVQSHILHFLGKTEIKIDGRKCFISEVSSKDAQSFFEQTHLSGFIKSSFYLGLIFNNELVACMSISKLRKWNKNSSTIKNDEFEITRWATKLGTNIRGGFSKILNEVRKKLNPSSITSFCDLRYGTGITYEKNGFRLLSRSSPNYWWHKSNKIRLTRYQSQKHKLKLILKDSFNEHLSESENMILNGWSKVEDCGNDKWEITFK